MSVPEAIHRLRRIYARTAPLYDLLDFPFERGRYRWLRPILLGKARGDILDLAVGTGRNMEFYPASTHVVGVDLSWGMLRRARCRNERGVPLAQMDATQLGFHDATFDTVVSTFLFCVLPDGLQPLALEETARVLRPGGRLLLLEYAYSKQPLRRMIMRLMAPWVEFAYGARFDRRTMEHLANGGWEIEEDRWVSGDNVRMVCASRPRD